MGGKPQLRMERAASPAERLRVGTVGPALWNVDRDVQQSGGPFLQVVPFRHRGGRAAPERRLRALVEVGLHLGNDLLDVIVVHVFGKVDELYVQAELQAGLVNLATVLFAVETFERIRPNLDVLCHRRLVFDDFGIIWIGTRTVSAGDEKTRGESAARNG